MLPGLPLRPNPVLKKTISSGLFTRTIFKGIFKLAHFLTSRMTSSVCVTSDLYNLKHSNSPVCGGDVIGFSS